MKLNQSVRKSVFHSIPAFSHVPFLESLHLICVTMNIKVMCIRIVFRVLSSCCIGVVTALIFHIKVINTMACNQVIVVLSTLVQLLYLSNPVDYCKVILNSKVVFF